MFEPVTITRSTSAWPPGAGAGAAPGGGGGGGGFCANALAAITNGTPTAAARATRTYPNVLNTFLIIGFSMGLVRFRSCIMLQPVVRIDTETNQPARRSVRT